MATRRNDDEKLEPANIEKVIALLEPADGKPITKKDACAILCISYNTARLASIIEKHKEKKAREAERRAALRGKPASKEEIKFIVESYLEGSTIDHISKSIYRGSTFVNNILEAYNVPTRAAAHDYFKPELIPEGAMRDRFKVGEIVYSARYDSTAKIDKELFQNEQFVYRIWLLHEKWRQFAWQEAAEIASLEHLKEIGVNF